MTEYTNGTGAVVVPMRGRAAPDYPTTTLPSGYTVQCRRLAAGLAANLNAQAYKELEPTKPAAPVQRVEVAAGEFRDVEHTGDPDYKAALEAWTNQVRQAGAMKLLKVIQSYALLTPTDEAAVAAYREAMTAVGLEVTSDDRELFVWSIVAPTPADQQALVQFILGISEAQMEAIQAQKRAFRGDVSGEGPRPLADADGA